MLGVIPASRHKPVEPRAGTSVHASSAVNMVAVAVGAPHLGQRLHQPGGAHRGPRKAADRRHVGLTGEHRIHRVEFVATGVAVFKPMSVSARITCRSDSAMPARR